jgi:hypothetical protein
LALKEGRLLKLKLLPNRSIETGSDLKFYSPDYFTAKNRFLAACDRLGFERHSLPIEAPSPNGEPLTIDVCVAGDAKPARALVVSSGVHGVEGFFGSAVQLAYLAGLPASWKPAAGTAVVVIHALNPFGFAWQWRFNEDNVDLNRNFLLADESYTGAPPLCGVFRRALVRHPRRPRLSPAASRLALIAMRHGVRSFWENLPVGQYEFSDWLFFGGSARSQSARLLENLLPRLLGSCSEVVHLDFHTGLGRWGRGKLLLSEDASSASAGWWRTHFGSSHVAESDGSPGRYRIRGGFGTWLKAQFPHCHYQFATAEFGTYSPLRVIRALADELHWHSRLGTQFPDHWARRRLAETFVPRDRRWRTQSLHAGLSLIHLATQAIDQSAHPPADLRTAS